MRNMVSKRGEHSTPGQYYTDRVQFGIWSNLRLKFLPGETDVEQLPIFIGGDDTISITSNCKCLFDRYLLTHLISKRKTTNVNIKPIL